MTTVSGADGVYRILLLRPGIYNVSVSQRPSSRKRERPWMFRSNQSATVDFQLLVAGVTETAKVVFDVALIDVNRSDLTNRVTGRTIDALPLKGRDFVNLIGLVPGAKPEPVSTQNPTSRSSGSGLAGSPSWWTAPRTTARLAPRGVGPGGRRFPREPKAVPALSL